MERAHRRAGRTTDVCEVITLTSTMSASFDRSTQDDKDVEPSASPIPLDSPTETSLRSAQGDRHHTDARGPARWLTRPRKGWRLDRTSRD
jgi:hypothetical protein